MIANKLLIEKRENEIMKKVFIDGSAGTTGLRIVERLSARDDIALQTLPESLRKDSAARREIMNESDIVFLCLPDDAAREAVAMLENENTVIIDTSTAHRTESGFTYGFPELSASFEERIKESKRISVPGCHASGFIALVKPLIDAGFVDSGASLCCHSLTGYSGGGKNMIAEYLDESRSELLDAPRIYGISQSHKHLKEMKAITGLSRFPVFCPIVSDFYSGMLVAVPLFAEQLKYNLTINDVKKLYSEKYTSPLVSYVEAFDENGFISAAGLSGSDRMEISVSGNDERMMLFARYDNLGKGASGAAVQCMNLKLGAEPYTGLAL